MGGVGGQAAVCTPCHVTKVFSLPPPPGVPRKNIPQGLEVTPLLHHENPEKDGWTSGWTQTLALLAAGEKGSAGHLTVTPNPASDMTQAA